VRHFEDSEISIVELKSVMFKSLYAWMTAYNSPHFPSFTKILDLYYFFPLSIIGDLSCILTMYTCCAPLCYLMRLIYL
jgi:hypothetical protein